MQIIPDTPRAGWPAFAIMLTVFVSLITDRCLCIRFYVQPHQKKCLKHEMYTNQLAVGEYEVSSMPGTTMDLTITDSKGHQALNRENVDGKGKFAVTSDSADYYELCFAYTVPPGWTNQAAREVYVEYRVGAEAKTYDQETNDKLSELESDLNRIEDLTNSIIVDFAQLKRREKEMRDTNESTNRRLFYQTVTSFVILLVLATWQVLYLRNFFRTRKLID
uniref:Transmembrane emp24 domain-containing protein bai n=1 Tax=Aceria tosichella TaxID=561515 RepID=A0A6G1SFH2_9ACAR